MMTTINILPDWLAPHKEVQVEFGRAGDEKGFLLNALVLDINLAENIVRIEYSQADPQVKQNQLDGQQMFVELHRLHPADEQKRLKPVRKPQQPFLGVPDLKPLRQISDSLSRQMGARESSDEGFPSDQDGSAASLLSWNSVSTSFYNLFASFTPSQRGTSPTRFPPPLPLAPRDRSFSDSMSALAQGLSQWTKAPEALMRAWSTCSQNEKLDGHLSDGIDYFDSGKDIFSEQDEGDEDELNSLTDEMVGYIVGEKVLVLSGNTWRNGVVLERYSNGSNYLVKLCGSHESSVRQFWASHVRKADE